MYKVRVADGMVEVNGHFASEGAANAYCWPTIWLLTYELSRVRAGPRAVIMACVHLDLGRKVLACWRGRACARILALIVPASGTSNNCDELSIVKLRGVDQSTLVLGRTRQVYSPAAKAFEGK